MVKHRSSIPRRFTWFRGWRVSARRTCRFAHADSVHSGEMLRRANAVLFRWRIDERLATLAVELRECCEPIKRMHEFAVGQREKERQHRREVNRQQHAHRARLAKHEVKLTANNSNRNPTSIPR